MSRTKESASLILVTHIFDLYFFVNLLHDTYHGIHSSIKLDNVEVNLFIFEFLDQFLYIKTFDRALREVVVRSTTYFQTMARCITNQEDLFSSLFSPILKQALFEAPLDIFTSITTSIGCDILDEIFTSLRVLSKRVDCKSFVVGEISITNERNPYFEISFTSLGYHLVDNLIYRVFGSCNPTCHRASTV